VEKIDQPMLRPTAVTKQASSLRHDWRLNEVLGLFQQSFNDLLYQAHSVHRHYFEPNRVQLSTLLNIKTGGCPEDCAYCPQSARYDTGLKAEPLLEISKVKQAAERAKEKGATRFCMGAAWRSPKDRDLDRVIEMIAGVRALGLETCATLGMLRLDQAIRLKQAGLDFYNHNLDTSESHYQAVITTRTYRDRLQTLEHVRKAGIAVCCGGIIGLGEGLADRCGLLITLANLPVHPESVPINMLVRVAGTPLAEAERPDPFDIIRTIAVARLLMPASTIRLSAGRMEMSDEFQALCFFAGANSIFYGERLLTTDNPGVERDRELFRRLGIEPSH
jgi:biotin synthase